MMTYMDAGLKNAIPIEKEPEKRTVPNNYKTITCPLIMWKILKVQITEKLYNSLINCSLRKRKDAAMGPEKHEQYYTLMNTFSRTAKSDEKNKLWCRSTTKSHMI